MKSRQWVTIGLVLGLSHVCACSFDASPQSSGTLPTTGAAGMTAAPVAEAGTVATAGQSPTTTAPIAGARAGSGAAGASVSAAGSGGSAAGAAAGAGAAGNGTAGSAAGSGGTAGGGGAMAAAGAPAPDMTMTGGLPAIMDPGMPGPFKSKETANVGPMGNYTTFQPEELGKDGIKHPILIWGPGAGAYPDIYKTLLDHVATHGFVVVSYNSTPQGPELNAEIDWIVAESKKETSQYFNKVDTTKIAMGGQSAGSLATFAAAKEDRILTTLHINGGTFDGNVSNLEHPAFFVCGDDPNVTGGDGTWMSDLARPNCDADFKNAKVPVWYGVVIGSSHTTVIDQGAMDIDPLKKLYLASTVAWLRYQLTGDATMKALFVGDDCGYCKDTKAWKVQQKDLK
jgi:hypothetical protein